MHRGVYEFYKPGSSVVIAAYIAPLLRSCTTASGLRVIKIHIIIDSAVHTYTELLYS